MLEQLRDASVCRIAASVDIPYRKFLEVFPTHPIIDLQQVKNFSTKFYTCLMRFEMFTAVKI
jgi:hypothetical protein